MADTQKVDNATRAIGRLMNDNNLSVAEGLSVILNMLSAGLMAIDKDAREGMARSMSKVAVAMANGAEMTAEAVAEIMDGK